MSRLLSDRFERWPKVLATMACTLFLAVLAPPTAQSAETTLERIRRTGQVRVGYAPESPFSFRTPDGRLTGAGPEVVRRVLAGMGVRELVSVESEFGTLIRDLHNGRFDAIVTGIAILPERCRQVAFSEPFYQAGIGLAVRPGNPKRLHGFDDVAADPSVRLGVVAGTVELQYARAAGVAEGQLVIFPDAAAAAGGVKAGRIDAYAAMAVTVQDQVQRAPRQLERAEPFRNPALQGRSFLEHGGFAFRPEDTELRDAFNRHLATLLRAPDYLDTIRPFGFGQAELPQKTTAELCASPSAAR